jgi:hypothetical protein
MGHAFEQADPCNLSGNCDLGVSGRRRGGYTDRRRTPAADT